MKLSTRTRYGIRAMLELAKNYKGGPLQIKIIAKEQDISVKYLEQLIAILRLRGFVRSRRGPRGGYMLAKKPQKVGLDEIFIALEGSVATVECVENENYCARATECVTKEVWTEIQDAIMGILGSVTLQDLVDRAIVKEKKFAKKKKKK